MKFLFIDDHAKLLGSLRSAFFNNSNVAFAECHSVKDALRAITKHRPDVVFLDHSLTEGGNEGLEIADRVEGVKIHSTTANRDVVWEYQKRGIESVGKTDLRKLKSIIAAQPTQKKEEKAMKKRRKKKVQNTATESLLRFIKIDEDSEKKEVVATAEALLKAKKAQQLKVFTKENLFGEGGVLRELPKDEQRELLAVVLTALEEETQNYIDRIGESRYADGIDWDHANLKPRLKHLLEAGKNGVFLPDWKKRVASIMEATHYYFSYFSEKAIRWNREEIQETAVEIEQLLGEVPEGLTGNGLEFASSSAGGGQKVYLNGQYVATVDARFSDSPTNGEIVAWLVVEQIDYCNFKGAQTSWKVFAWKSGLKEPKEVFEDHAYSAERSLSVGAPVVSKDGKIIVTISTNGKKSTRKVSLTR